MQKVSSYFFFLFLPPPACKAIPMPSVIKIITVNLINNYSVLRLAVGGMITPCGAQCGVFGQQAVGTEILTGQISNGM
jgi:hypothetical protein